MRVFRLYEIGIAPVLRAARATRVVEIGALQGETTVKLLDLLGPESELHVIDPVPQFDPAEHERRFPGRYHFHRDISHNVLPRLPAVDAALIDGDHNWYTVHTELEMLAASAREAGAPLPLLFLHDVGWPYGRRDLYYAPERIPEEFRQPYARGGLAPGEAALRRRGGLNPGHDNATGEGGPRNGVLTALEDFLSGDAGSWRLVVVPVYFGLAIAAERARVAREPALAGALDALEAPDGRRAQAELAEALRVRKVAEARTAADGADARIGRAAGRYLDVVKGALLDEHYLENEVRLDYLHGCARRGAPPDPLRLRDPRMWLTKEMKRLQEARRTGAAVRTLADRPIFPYTTIGRTGLDRLQGCLERIRAERIPGDLVACGVWRGGVPMFMRAFLEAHEVEDRAVWVADSFGGPHGSGDDGEAEATRFPTLVADLNVVREGFDRFGLLDDRVRFLQGPVAETLADAPIGDLALIHLGDEDGDIGAGALEHLYDRLTPGGFVLIEHYDSPNCRRAVEGFRDRWGITDAIERIDWAGAAWRKVADAGRARRPPPPRRQLDRAPLVGPVTEGAVALSVVVVFHDMRREAERTLHSLSRSYQQGIEDLDYEVVVVENGSEAEQGLGEELVRSFGPEFRYLDLGADSTPSPAHAMNRGIAIARGEYLALMIDGAHVVTPGLLRFGMLGLRTYAPAIVTAHQWFLGPGQQGEAMDGGYDRDYEDRLFERIGWPTDGYRLFEIGNFIGDRDWFDGLWESNCLFTPRGLLEQVGGLDETFAMPGGGYANLDLFERLGATPQISVVGVLGEASFHQLHGGTTTNQPDIGERHGRLMAYRDHYERVRGRPFRGPGKPRHFVGRLTGPALRTRPRWNTANAFKEAQRLRANGIPEKPTPVPEQLQAEFTDAFWRSLAWRDTTWLGRPVERSPSDLVAYQELIARVRPDWIVAVRSADGARSLFFASICDLVGRGRVLSIQTDAEGERPEHPRITYLTGRPAANETRRQVLETVGENANALVVIAPAPQGEIVREFRAYAPLVGAGSYAIIESTIVNGHPVLPGYGPGPFEAIQMILKNRNDFVPDHGPERFGLTFNPRGFLRRVP